MLKIQPVEGKKQAPLESQAPLGAEMFHCPKERKKIIKRKKSYINETSYLIEKVNLISTCKTKSFRQYTRFIEGGSSSCLVSQGATRRTWLA